MNCLFLLKICTKTDNELACKIMAPIMNEITITKSASETQKKKKKKKIVTLRVKIRND
jgi:hypothetical protein